MLFSIQFEFKSHQLNSFIPLIFNRLKILDEKCLGFTRFFTTATIPFHQWID